MWFCLTVVGFIVCGVIESDDLPPGNPAKLTHMLDYDGGICSVTDGVEDKPYAYFLPSGQVYMIGRSGRFRCADYKECATKLMSRRVLQCPK